MLQEQYEEYQHNENKDLVKNLLGADSYEEAVEMLREDAQAYRKYRTDMENINGYGDIRQGISGVTVELANNFNTLGEKVRVTSEGLVNWEKSIEMQGDTLFSYIQNSFQSIVQNFMDTHRSYQEQLHTLLRQELQLMQDIPAVLVGNEAKVPQATYQQLLSQYTDIFTGIVENDKTQAALGNKGKNDVLDSLGYIDYSARMIQALQNGDFSGFYSNASLRQTKFNNVYSEGGTKTWADYGWLSNYELVEQAHNKGQITEEQWNTFVQAYTDSQKQLQFAEEMSRLSQERGNQVASEINQMVVQLATMLPPELQTEAQNIIFSAVNGMDIINGTTSLASSEVQARIAENGGIFSDSFINAMANDDKLCKEVISTIAQYSEKIASAVSSAVQAKTDSKAQAQGQTLTIGGITGGGSGGGGSSGGGGYTAPGTYNVNTEKGSTYLSVLSGSKAGTTLTGGDGSKWTADGKGGVTITDTKGNSYSSDKGQITTGGNTRNVWKGYAGGIENGPVTYTGLALLHGSASKPEYVFNSDQAYNILKTIATGKRAMDIVDTASSLTGSNDTNYIVEGDIVLEGLNDPSKFWDGVTTAMGTRWNVTKKRANY